MADYGFVNLADNTLNTNYPIGPLPYQIEAWDGASHLLEDLDQTNASLGYTGLGAYPVIYFVPDFSPTTQKLDTTYTYVINNDKTITATQNILSLTPAELANVLIQNQTTKSQVVNDLTNQILASGWTNDFGSTIGVQTLQTRDTVDIANWLTSQAAYSALVAVGQGASMGANFRSESNTTFTLTYQQGLNALLAMAAWGAAVKKQSWDLKDKIFATQSVDDLNKINVSVGWPSNNVTN